MAELMDMILVGIVLLGALGAVIKFFLDLGKAPANESISCAGCNSTCHSEVTRNEDYGLLRKIK